MNRNLRNENSIVIGPDRFANSIWVSEMVKKWRIYLSFTIPNNPSKYSNAMIVNWISYFIFLSVHNSNGYLVRHL